MIGSRVLIIKSLGSNRFEALGTKPSLRTHLSSPKIKVTIDEFQ